MYIVLSYEYLRRLQSKTHIVKEDGGKIGGCRGLKLVVYNI